MIQKLPSNKDITDLKDFNRSVNLRPPDEETMATHEDPLQPETTASQISIIGLNLQLNRCAFRKNYMLNRTRDNPKVSAS